MTAALRYPLTPPPMGGALQVHAYVIWTGWGQAALEDGVRRFGDYGDYISELPASFRKLSDGQRLRIGEHDWEVVVGKGHSPEHACLYNAALKLFISGDQVLPRISSNVSVSAMAPHADPMADWFASLDRVQARVPDEVLVLPAHHACFHGLHPRIEQLRADQQGALTRLRALLDEPRRVIDAFPALFSKPIAQDDASHLELATGEAIACLNHLIHRGEVRREVADGVAWYRRQPNPQTP